MTLDEYQMILEKNRKVPLGLKVEERKVTIEKEFESMQQLPSKKKNDEIFVKLGSDRDKGKNIASKEKTRKAGGEKPHTLGGRRRGGGGEFSGSGGLSMNEAAPSVEDPREFPKLPNKI